MNRLRTHLNAAVSAPARLSGAVLSSAVLSIGLLGGLTAANLGVIEAIAPKSTHAQSASRNPEIKVGIVQRFGAEKDDKITLGPLAGDQLTVTFKTGSQTQTLTTDRLQIEVTMQPLETPELQEWVVLSTHRSFESAEDSAKRWQDAGINAEIAQPDAWQVWAKREDYNSPLVRRLLIDNLHAAGYTRSFIDSEVVKEVPKATFTANGYKYARDEFTITSANRRIQMAEGNRTSFRDIFAGDMKIQPNSYGDYTLVNQVPIELYLRGVVPHEIGPGAPRNAIKAQAVLARTYALRNLRRFAIDDYELCADTQCQVYFGLADTDPGSDAAIAATAGQVLTYDNELVDALYSSTSGGITAHFTDVWNGEDRPYLIPRIDSLQSFKWDLEARPLSDEANFRAFISLDNGFNEVGWPLFRWNRTATLKEMNDTLKLYLRNRQHPLASYTELRSLTVVDRAASGRVQKLTVETDLGSFDLIKDESVKALVPPRSLLFYVEPVMTVPDEEKPDSEDSAGQESAGQNSTQEQTTSDQTTATDTTQTTPDTTSAPGETGTQAGEDNNSAGDQQNAEPVLSGFRFVGGGFGHGVGMSQTGAYNLGEQGYTHQQILEFYYPGTTLQPISESVTFYDGD
ncbi:MAG: SpoIID/LytB domain-containing protein [Cyanobacteria bacterium J06634_6]